MRKTAIALVTGLFILGSGAALASEERMPTSLADQKNPGQVKELAAKQTGPKRGPILPPRPIDIKPIDRDNATSAVSGPGLSVGALVPATSGASANSEKIGLERELRRLATRLK